MLNRLSLCFVFLFFSNVVGHSQKSDLDTLVEISHDFFCREFVKDPAGRKGNFLKTEYYSLISKADKVYFAKYIFLEDQGYDSTGSSNGFIVRYKPVEILNFDLNSLNDNGLSTMQQENLLPFISSYTDSGGNKVIDTINSTHSCIVHVKFHRGQISFEKKINLDLLRQEYIFPDRVGSTLTIRRNLSFTHNKKLLLVSVYELMKRMADIVHVEGDFEVD